MHAMNPIAFLNPNRFVSVPYQVILMACTVLICGYLIRTALFTSTYEDPAPTIYPFTPETAKLIGIGSKSITVETGIFIENFNEFDINNNNFVISAVVWFKFDPSITSLETLGSFSFEKGDILNISKPETKLIDKLLFAQYRIKLKFSTNLNLRLFPADDHTLNLILTNRFISPKEIIFESSEANLVLSENIQIPSWKKSTTNVNAGYTQAILDRHNQQLNIYNPVVLYQINFTHSGMRQILVIIIPLFFILFVAFLSLTLDPKEFSAQRMALGIANITAVIGYRFVIEGISPKVGYLMLSDQIFNLFLATTFLIFFFNMATLKTASPLFRGITLITFHIVFISVWYYLCIIWTGL